ncbi:hypothetical protein TetV_614 [Tetraselmis virus 1]|uniref:Uncharacterized protein n=1 Tax=Tetraselmis virus 1 TaxID=2060617 RepID=A0A2P0VP56_9VIRU|nr:hypothetical protein QJ968_gp440 [Tetraselmis virus 1]AUF82696.1 hypothetical protein TetV_614 [Tetraselmis virus 1]
MKIDNVHKCLLFCIVLVCVACVTVAMIKKYALKKTSEKKSKEREISGTKEKSCGCKELDPVTSPSYNMVQSVKQMILLEEHLNVPKKRCNDCITKHFLHIIGLLEEAVSMAGPKDDCAFMTKCAKYFDNLYKRWKEGADPKDVAYYSRYIRKEIMGRYT